MAAALIAGVVGFGLLFLWFVRLERTGREIVVVAFIVALLVVDAALYPGFEAAPGVFHPTFGALSFRPYEVVIVLALAARLLSQGAPRRISAAGLWWLAFFGWLLTQAVVGLYVRHPAEIVAFEAKVIVYLGAMVLAAGIPAEEYAYGKIVTHLVAFASAVASLMIVLDFSGLRFTGAIPGIRVEEFGRIGSDLASILLAIGTVALSLGMAKGRGGFALVLAAAPLMVTVFVPSQRAVLLSFACLVVLIPMALVTATAWKRLRAAPAEVVMAALAVVALIMIPEMVSAWKGKETAPLPLVARASASFTSPAKLQSAEDRINQYRKAWPLITQKPLFGWGLGKTFFHYQPGPNEFIVSNVTHNIATDLVLRTGAVGLALFAVALTLSLSQGLRVWRENRNDAIACLALACLLVVVGLLAKGVVESIFEKFRLAVLMGIFLGMLRSLAVSHSLDRQISEPYQRIAP